MPPAAEAPPLSALLRARTAEAHAAAEQAPFLAAIAEGRVSRDGLAALLGRLLPVYDALEAVGARWADDARVGRFVRPELHRAARLRADLQHLTGSSAAAPTPAATAYADRVTRVGSDSAAGFVAHHYTRCLGDLAGGQVLRAALARRLGVDDGSGASFFAFPGLRTGPLRQAYRGWLDEASFAPDEREELVAEALVAYRLNLALAAELDADLDRWTTP